MTHQHRIYLDNAATSWPKPQAVYDAVDDYQRRQGAAVGRGGYAEAGEVGKAVEDTRVAVARLIGAESPERIVFTFNGTDSLNLAIHGTLRPGDHVVTTVVEHNSVLRPLRWLEKRKRNEVTCVGCDSSGVIDPDTIRAAMRAETKLVILTHASNVTGAIQPVAEVGRIARRHGALFLVDAAQTLGHMPISVAELGADLVAAPGHKGLFGPLGTGILYIRPDVEELVESIRQGGTGISSFDDNQPEKLPEKYESGNHNAPGILGLGAGVKYLEGRGLKEIRQHAIDLTELLLRGLTDLPTVQIFGPGQSEKQVGVVSFSVTGYDPPTFAKTLDETYHIQARAGLQCAALMHRALGTLENGGTVRFSVGPFNGESDVEAAVQATRSIATFGRTPVGRVSCPCVSGGSRTAEMTTSAGAEAIIPQDQIFGIAAINGLQDLWQQTLGDPNVCIAVLDGPVDLSHPCFEGANISTLPSINPSDPDSGPASQHGTHVASVIFGQHESSVKGIAPKCRGVSIPIFKDKDDTSFVPCSQVDLVRAISQALEAGADIINISGGQFSPSGAAHPILADIVKKCADRGVLLVAAGGNEGCECLHIPGAIPSVLAVGAMNLDGAPLEFSNWGYGAEGILALGEGIVGARPNGEIGPGSGTSFATPIVSGVAGLLMSLRVDGGNRPSAAIVRSTLIGTALDCKHQKAVDCNRLLAGRINISRAYESIKKGDLSMKPSDQDQPLSNKPHYSDENGGRNFASANAGQQPESIADMPVVSTLASQVADSRSNAVQPAGGTTDSRESPSFDSVASPFASGKETRTAVLPASFENGGSSGGAQKVYALGKLFFDYGTRSRRMYFANAMKQAFNTSTGVPDIDSPQNLYNYLVRQSDAKYNILEGNQFIARAEVGSFNWILKIDETPIYAIAPMGPVALDIHDTLVGFLNDQLSEGAERISVPGIIIGETQLFFGETVPVIQPDIRGMFSWKTSALSAATLAKTKGPDQAAEDLEEFLARVYEQTRNLGTMSEHRAINYAATDALITQGIFNEVHEKQKFQGYELDSLYVKKSPICRQDMDCWDIQIIFYDPNNLQRARRGFRFTIDVSDVMPVILGHRKEFSLR